MTRRWRLVLTLAACAAALGCHGNDADRGFAPVQKTVRDRVGHEVRWRSDPAAATEIDAAVQKLLADELTAERAVQVALLCNRALQARFERLGLAQADLIQAGLLRNPVLSAEVRFFGSGTNFELTLTQQLVELLYMPLRLRVGEAGVQAAQAAIARDALAVAGDVRRAFYAYQAAAQTQEVLAQVVEATGLGLELSQRLFDAGNITPLELENSAALAGQARLDLAASEVATIAGRERLNAQMGLWGPRTQWRSATRLPDPPPEDSAAADVEQRAVAQSLELAAARRLVEQAGAKSDLARPLAILGDAAAGVATESEPAGEWGVGPALDLPIPLWDVGQGAAARAAAEQRAAEQTYWALAVRTRAAARTAQARVTAARQRVAYFQDVMLPLRQRIVDETQRRYNAMLLSSFELFFARQQQIEAGRAYVDALLDYWTARATLDQILSGSLPEAADAGA